MFRTTAVLSLSCIVIAAGALHMAPAPEARAHCQVPCGIFDEAARIKALQEDTTTIAKAQKLMNELAGKDDAQSKQQFVRWTVEKEKHAQRIMETIADYFVAQRIKPVAKPGDDASDEEKAKYADYLQNLADHHAVTFAAMKTKHSADPKTAETLAKAIDVIAHRWAPHDHHHH